MIDIDECSLGTNNCDVNAICTNTIGSYSCKCKPGYIGNGTECFACNENEYSFNETICVSCPDNSISSFASSSIVDCKCLPGYAGTQCDIQKEDCRENGCQNNGKCVIISFNDTAYCDCTNTGFDGINCQTQNGNYFYSKKEKKIFFFKKK